MRTPPALAASLSAFAALVLLAAAFPAEAHGFGQRYDLPLPLGLFMGGAATAVALTFLLLVLFLPLGERVAGRAAARARRHPFTADPEAQGALVRLVLSTARALSFSLFLLILLAGFFGNPDPFKNLAPVAVWVVGWVGLAFASLLFGDLWRVLSPFEAGFRLLEQVTGRARPERPCPHGQWPAVALLLLFAWAELVWPERDRPAALASVLLGYALLTWAGMWRYGRATWRDRGELFAAVFGLFARLAPLDLSRGSLRPRLPAAGLMPEQPVSWSETALVLLLLSSVTFDGLLETPLWSDFAHSALAGPLLTLPARALGVEPYSLLASLALAVFPLCFGGAYLLVAAAMARMARAAGGRASAGELARRFVLTLVPIAVAYHLAHYLAYLLLAGQFIIPLASDPFGWGWNLFGTRLYFLRFDLIDARTAWYAAITLIVAGHATAVLLAHLLALGRFPPAGTKAPHAGLASQIPLLLLMLAYTAVSLWILAQPITEFSG